MDDKWLSSAKRHSRRCRGGPSYTWSTIADVDRERESGGRECDRGGKRWRDGGCGVDRASTGVEGTEIKWDVWSSVEASKKILARSTSQETEAGNEKNSLWATSTPSFPSFLPSFSLSLSLWRRSTRGGAFIHLFQPSLPAGKKTSKGKNLGYTSSRGGPPLISWRRMERKSAYSSFF